MSRFCGIESRCCSIFRTMLIFILSLVGPVFVMAPWTPAGAGEADVQAGLSAVIRHVAEQNMSVVVQIKVTQRQEATLPHLFFGEDPFSLNLFNGPQIQRDSKLDLMGVGTGIIFNRQGYILTSRHVAVGATKLQVSMDDGRRRLARLVGTDQKTGLAVILVSTEEPLPYVTFGDSDRMEVGDWVVALGYSADLSQTVSQGIISADHRRGLTNPSRYRDFLQTDATIHPGNIGGPLLNLQGEVIGINAAVAHPSADFRGIGFAIPSNMAIYVARHLIEHGKVERGWIGVQVDDLTPDQAETFGLKEPEGALIARVVREGPAYRAGVKEGDVVTRFAGKPISDSSQLQNEVAGCAIGEKIDLTVFRDGTRRRLSVKIGALEEMNRRFSAIKYRLGVDVRPLTAGEADRYHLGLDMGLVITAVRPESPLVSCGVEVNDVMVEINGSPIRDLGDFSSVISRLRAKQSIILLGVDHRSGRSGYIQVVVP